MRTNRDGHLVRFYNLLLAEAANAARMNDPYVLYGKVYETSKSDEPWITCSTLPLRAVTMMMPFTIWPSQRRRGEQTSLLYKEYLVVQADG